MAVRKDYKLTEEQHSALLAASQPTPVMYLSGGQPMYNSPQQNAIDAWRLLGKKLGFRGDSVLPIVGRDSYHFSAVPIERQ